MINACLLFIVPNAPVVVVVGIRTSEKEILLCLLSPWVQLITEFFGKVSCSMFNLLVSLVRIGMSSKYLRYNDDDMF